MENEELLPKPQTDLPLPEKEIPAEAGLASQGETLRSYRKTNILKSKFFLGFVALSFLIAFLVGGFVLGKNSTNKQVSQTTTVTQAPSQPSTPIPTIDYSKNWRITDSKTNSGWKKYTNNELGFSIEYPNNWHGPVWPCHGDNNVCFNSPQFSTANFQEKPNESGGAMGIQKDATGLSNFCKNSKCEKTEINNLTAYKITQDLVGPNESSLSYYVSKGNATFTLGGMYVSSDLETKKEIEKSSSTFTFAPLSTSKFTDSSADTSTWKTYTNAKNNLQLKYPTSYLVEEDFGQGSSYDVYFFSSVTEKSEFDKCIIGDGIECNAYSLGIKFNNENKTQVISLGSFLKDLGEDPTKYISLIVGGSPALQNQFNGIGIVNNTYVYRGTSVFHIFANSILNENENMAIYEQMLSTFKFKQ